MSRILAWRSMTTDATCIVSPWQCPDKGDIDEMCTAIGVLRIKSDWTCYLLGELLVTKVICVCMT